MYGGLSQYGRIGGEKSPIKLIFASRIESANWGARYPIKGDLEVPCCDSLARSRDAVFFPSIATRSHDVGMTHPTRHRMKSHGQNETDLEKY